MQHAARCSSRPMALTLRSCQSLTHCSYSSIQPRRASSYACLTPSTLDWLRCVISSTSACSEEWHRGDVTGGAVLAKVAARGELNGCRSSRARLTW